MNHNSLNYIINYKFYQIMMLIFSKKIFNKNIYKIKINLKSIKMILLKFY